MRIVEKVLNKVLHKGFSAFVLSFAQNFFRLAPTKSDYFFNSIRGVLESFKRLSFFLLLFIFGFCTMLFLAVKSLEANLVIKSSVVMS